MEKSLSGVLVFGSVMVLLASSLGPVPVAAFGTGPPSGEYVKPENNQVYWYDAGLGTLQWLRPCTTSCEPVGANPDEGTDSGGANHMECEYGVTTRWDPLTPYLSLGACASAKSEVNSNLLRSWGRWDLRLVDCPELHANVDPDPTPVPISECSMLGYWMRIEWKLDDGAVDAGAENQYCSGSLPVVLCDEKPDHYKTYDSTASPANGASEFCTRSIIYKGSSTEFRVAPWHCRNY